MRHAGVRVVAVLARSDDTIGIAEDAQRHEMMAGWAWISAGADEAFDPSVTAEARTRQGWLYISAAQGRSLSQFDAVSHGGERSNGSSVASVSSVSSVYVDSRAAALYDAVWLFAHGAAAVLDVGGDVTDGRGLVDAMWNVSFEAIGLGLLRLDPNGDPIVPCALMNYVRATDGEMRGVEVGQYMAADSLAVDNVAPVAQLWSVAVVWPGNKTTTPRDTVLSCPSLGMFVDVDTNQCRTCPRGHFNTEARATHCSECPAGEIGLDSTKCVVCPRGSFSNASAMSSCFQCVQHSSNVFETDFASRTIPLDFAPSESRFHFCRCEPGHAGVESLQAVGGIERCIACPAGVDCTGVGTVVKNLSLVEGFARAQADTLMVPYILMAYVVMADRGFASAQANTLMVPIDLCQAELMHLS